MVLMFRQHRSRQKRGERRGVRRRQDPVSQTISSPSAAPTEPGVRVVICVGSQGPGRSRVARPAGVSERSGPGGNCVRRGGGSVSGRRTAASFRRVCRAPGSHRDPTGTGRASRSRAGCLVRARRAPASMREARAHMSVSTIPETIRKEKNKPSNF